ncbi:DUF6221 family protein [Streptomyces vinaceus]|uniref:DUF6221 family protein n=1 Tax=Streptomyces vinaceus TaxID=1960 RepID=UPI00381EC9CD
MTDPRVPFLRARYAEEDQAAREAGQIPCGDAWLGDPMATWRAGSTPHGGQWGGLRWYVEDGHEDGVVGRVDPQAAQDEDIARHIARYDPAHVLSDLAARQKALDACAYFLHDNEDGPDPCAEAVLTAFVQPYASHPEFPEEWRS